MKAIHFPEVTNMFAESDEDFQALPVCISTVEINGKTHDCIISCWELTDEDLVNLTKNRKLWLSLIAHPQEFPPVAFYTETPFIEGRLQ